MEEKIATFIREENSRLEKMKNREVALDERDQDLTAREQGLNELQLDFDEK